MIELEKKWLVDESKCPVFNLNFGEKNLEILETEQGYLENDPDDSWIIRFRHIFKHLSESNHYFLDLKSKGLLAREELTYSISYEEYSEAIQKCEGRIVRKTRYCYEENGHRLEIDKYNAHGFVTCEVEFKSMKEANTFVPPEWCIEEVTFDPKYKNMNLGV